MVKVSVVSVTLPQSSEAVQVMLASPVAAQSSERSVVVLVTETPPHSSMTVMPPCQMASQALISSTFPLPSHSTTSEPPCGMKVGGVVSSMVNVADVVLVLPWMSVAVKVTKVAPVSPHASVMLATS